MSETDGTGFVFLNPDIGTEYAVSHPVESGEVPDALDIRRSTSFEDDLVRQLRASGNYVADDPASPREVRFANGRVVRLSADGSHLVVTPADGQPAPPRRLTDEEAEDADMHSDMRRMSES